jgi:hypothetical protein
MIRKRTRPKQEDKITTKEDEIKTRNLVHKCMVHTSCFQEKHAHLDEEKKDTATQNKTNSTRDKTRIDSRIKEDQRKMD